MTISTTHHGQHDESCFLCKARSLSYNNGQPKTHVHRGDPWDGNPVLERIQELQAGDAKEKALWEAKQQHPSGPREPTTEGV